MLKLADADHVEVLVLVDNVTDNLSSAPDYVDNELPLLWKRGLRLWSGRCMCCAAHGLSCAIHCHARRHGPHAALRHRARRLGV
jgi:7,8-dihydropterin-6-yl-methyl-4-(beta-D-ribofuranosyl)aminobenzene 5'-phosphate synthase